MSDLLLDPLTGDLDLTGKRVNLTSSVIEETRQKVEIRLRTLRGEWFANILAGLPYFQSMLGKGVTKSLIDTQIKSTIINTQGVLGIAEFESNLDPRMRTYTAVTTITTSEGETSVTFNTRG